MNLLDSALQNYREYAKVLGDYESIPLDEVANKYCEATDNRDEQTRNIYFSVLVLRFWYKINRMYQENPTLNIDKLDCYNWLTDAILMVCEPEKRVWQKNTNLNVWQVVNQTLATRFVAAAYYESNLKKNDGKHNLLSLDDLVNEEDQTTLGDLIPDTTYMPEAGENAAIGIVQEYINSNKLVEAIILDNVANKDVFKHKKHTIKEVNDEGKEEKHVEWSTTFWPFKLVKELSSLDEEYVKYFSETYKVSYQALEAAYNAIIKATNQKKYKMVSATLSDLEKLITKEN